MFILLLLYISAYIRQSMQFNKNSVEIYTTARYRRSTLKIYKQYNKVNNYLIMNYYSEYINKKYFYDQ